MSLEVITVGNGSNEYFGNFTRKEITIIKEYIIEYSLNLFSGKSLLGDVRVDYQFGNIKMNVFEYLNTCKRSYKTVIIDAPYNKKLAIKYQKLSNTPKQFIIFANTKDTTILFNLITEKIKPEIIILKSWNYYIPKGYRLKKGYLCYAGGFRKSTILLILERKK